MENFPILKNKQVALLRADTQTGHVLDEYFILVIDDDQKVYTILNNLDEALKVAKLIIQDRKNIECVIYDQNQKVLSFLNPESSL